VTAPPAPSSYRRRALSQAEDLLDQDIHATTLAQGYREAAEEATAALEEIAIDVDEGDTEILEQIAATAMTGKGAENAKDLLAELIVEAVRAVADDDGVDTDNIKVEKVVGGSVENSELVEGVIVDKERVSDSMPYFAEDADVATSTATSRSRRPRSTPRSTSPIPTSSSSSSSRRRPSCARWPRKSLMSVPMSSSSTAASTTWPSTTSHRRASSQSVASSPATRPPLLPRDRRNAGLERRRPDRGRPRCRR